LRTYQVVTELKVQAYLNGIISLLARTEHHTTKETHHRHKQKRKW